MTLSEYIEQHSSPESTVLQQITRSTHLEVINPRMLSGHVQGRVLSMFSQMIQPKRILELGTFTGQYVARNLIFRVLTLSLGQP